MIGGQVVDIESERAGSGEKTDDKENLDIILFIHEHKTAAMIESAMGIGAVLAGASELEKKKSSRLLRISVWLSRSGMTFWM